MSTVPDWFISDTHFDQERILDYQPSRYGWAGSVEEMNEVLVREWNRCVSPGQTVLHCGDFAFGPRERIPQWRSRLNGRIILVVGNHDRSPRVMSGLGFEVAVKQYEFEFEGKRYRARHNPASFALEEAETASILLHGHTHSHPAPAHIAPAIRGKCRCVSVESLPTVPAPVSLRDLQLLSPPA